jgi:hypothetical protein
MNLLGVLVSDLEDDDYEGKCKCTVGAATSPNFPLLNIVAEASQENTSNVDHYNCKNGNFPKIHN